MKIEQTNFTDKEDRAEIFHKVIDLSLHTALHRTFHKAIELRIGNNTCLDTRPSIWGVILHIVGYRCYIGCSVETVHSGIQMLYRVFRRNCT